MHNVLKKVLMLLTIVAFSILLVLLTPLKWVNLVEPGINDIDSRQFFDQFVSNKEKYLFIDVRSQSSYNELHAEGSINIPLHMLYDERHVLPKNGKEIILICSGGRASGVAYHYLQHHGFFNIARIEGGIEKWQEAGLPVTGSSI